jgi:hypothetical protein
MKKENLSKEQPVPALCKADVMPLCLRLPLKAKWFEKTKQRIKPEDYREITPYWFRRFVLVSGEMYSDEIDEFCNDLKNSNIHPNVTFDRFGCALRTFDVNIMTSGYPKSTDFKRIVKLEHKGIEIRTGKREWGAEQNKIYFVVMHGAILA